MADAAIRATIQLSLQTVMSLAADRVSLVLGFKTDLERLSNTADTIGGFLADADDKMHSAGVQNWLERLEREALKAENVLDELNYDNLRRKVKYQNQLVKKKVCFFFSFFHKIGFRSRLASMIKEINTNLERINREANDLGLVYKHQIGASLSTTAAARATTSRQTDSIIVQRDVLGREEDESKIVEMLLSPSDSVVSVIPKTGMGGLGKTTLAKAVYNNKEIVGHFDKKIWVCVAKPVEIVELFKMILESSTRKKAEVDVRDAIVQEIRDDLKEKRYFLVLDDMWNDQEVLLNDFFTTLKGLDAKKGSWCLVTARLEQVASNLSRHPQMNVAPYQLGKLGDEECWSIVKKWANLGEEVPKELQGIKKKVLKRCDGLPLAASLIGGLLSKKGKDKWLSILEESLLNGDQGGITQILKVSFDHLSPAPVKKCWAYCSIFPQDTELEQDQLIELWMAEGFLQPHPQNERVMEDIGYEYLRILLQHSVLEEVKGKQRTWYKMHDLVHEFAKSVLNQGRYLAVNSSEGTVENNITKPPTLIHSLFLKGSISDDMLSKLENLHVLRLFGAGVKVLPTSIGKLIYLHLLDISGSEITTLPKSLCKLYNLQTLRIDNDKLERGLPKKMSNLIRLRHLHYYCGSQSQTPSQIGRLTCLQTLKFFDVGRQGKGHGIEELGTLRDLKGSLEIRNLEFVKGKEGAKLAKLFEKPNLSRLAFKWSSGDRESDKCDDEDVLEGLQPHPNLKGLEIHNFRGDRFPQWLVKSSTLVKLKLMNCRNLPTLGQISSLQDLFLSRLENTTCIGLPFYGASDEVDGRSGGLESRSGGLESISRQRFFPALKSLTLANMGNLTEWKDPHEGSSTAGEVHEEDVFPLLERLDIMYCPQLTTIPTPGRFPSLKELDITNDCHVSLAEKVLSNITILSSLKLRYGGSTVNSLQLKKGPECSLRINGCGSLSTNMLERLCLLPSLQCVELESLPNITTLRAMSCATCLESLELRFCENLQELPEDLYKFQALRLLEIWVCPKINLLGLNPDKGQESLLKSLEEFVIMDSCNELTRLPVEMLDPCTSLRNLRVRNCPNLVSFPLDLRRTPSLQMLWLCDCPKLITEMPRGFGFLTSLREVWIGSYSDYSVIEFDWSGLASSSTLRKLHLSGNHDTESLPHQLQYLTTITSLYLTRFGAIEVVPDWLGNLVSLEELRVWDCQKLQYLPSTATMRQLTKLRYLGIRGCRWLTKRCTPQEGANSEWPKISHISERHIR